jgi:hypothetical protein
MSSSYGEGLETAELNTQAPRQSLTRQPAPYRFLEDGDRSKDKRTCGHG